MSAENQTEYDEYFVTEETAGSRLDVWLHAHCDFLPSRNFAANWIEAGQVTLQRKSAKPALKLRTGDIIRVRTLPEPDRDPAPQSENIPLRIIFEDEHLIVINKQPGLVVHPGAGVPSGTLVNAILWHCGTTLPSLGSQSRAGIVHRLDRDTSGVMVVAKSQLALTHLSQSFASHAQNRVYQAICYGYPKFSEQTVETGYGRNPRIRTQYAVLPSGEGKRACTTVSVAESLLGGLLSRIECRLETGRTHQIRVHMTHIGHPLVGDPVYGQPSPNLKRHAPEAAAWLRRNVTRQLLHASLLGFNHPATQKYLEFHADLEADMETALDYLRGFTAQPNALE
jgi:23S rRNA pseudouridine1911/1915/1917 synthase